MDPWVGPNNPKCPICYGEDLDSLGNCDECDEPESQEPDYDAPTLREDYEKAWREKVRR